MKTTRTVLALLLCLLCAPAAHAKGPDITTGNGLLSICGSPQDYYDKGNCIGFIIGVARSLRVLDGDDALTCVPESATFGQMRDIAVRYLRTHPETRHTESADLAISAWREAFCPAAPAARTDNDVVDIGPRRRP